MSASGGKADVKSSEIHEYEGPLSASSGHLGFGNRIQLIVDTLGS